MPKIASNPFVNPRCPFCGCTSDRIAPGRFMCRVRECRKPFSALDPDYNKSPTSDRIGITDLATPSLVKGVPTPWPRCPHCGGTSDKLKDGTFKCRVRECREVFSGDRPN